MPDMEFSQERTKGNSTINLMVNSTNISERKKINVVRKYVCKLFVQEESLFGVNF